MAIPNIREYIFSYTEQVVNDSLNTLVNNIVAQYTQAKVNNKEEELVEEPPPVMHKKALQALHTLRRYKEQNKYRNLKLLR
jgi:hypothetical protein